MQTANNDIGRPGDGTPAFARAFFSRKKDDIRAMTAAMGDLEKQWGYCREAADKGDLKSFQSALSHFSYALNDLDNKVSAIRQFLFDAFCAGFKTQKA